MKQARFGLSRTRLLAVAAMVVAAGLSTTGCKQINEKLSGKSEKKCERGLQIARVALKQENFELVKQWRTYSYKHCPDTSEISKLDQEIVAKQNEVRKREATNALGRKIAGLFKTFAESQVQNPSGNCFPKDDPQAGWCTKTQRVKGADTTFSCRYRDEEKDWIRFDATVPGEIKCKDLGAAPIRRWTVKRTTGVIAKRTRCQVRGGPLNGYHVLLSTEPTGTTITLFSSKTLMKDNALRQRVEREGK